MKVNKNIFRGYDIRGVVDKDLNAEVALHIGKAYGTFLNMQNISLCIVGRDARLTSKEYSDAIIKGILSCGINVIDIGLTMVGTLYWSQYYYRTKGAVMVTASHNPKDFNGFKLAVGYSETMVTEEINWIRETIEKEEYFKSQKPGIVKEESVNEAYEEMLHEKFHFNKSKRVLVDPSHATPGVIVPNILRSFGFEVIEKHCNPDGNFPLGTADPTEKNVAERLSKEVVEEIADIGFTYDSDGDRIGIVDEKGGIIWNDQLIAIFAEDVLQKSPGATIMFNTLCSKVVSDVILEYGGVPFMWRTGHSFLKKKNQEVQADFIGELSGHFFFSKEFYNHDDGVYTTLRLLSFLEEQNIKLSEAVDKLPKYISSPEIKVNCADDKKVELMNKVAPILRKDFPDAEIIDDERAGDGIRAEMEDSMFVIRYSQNGPYLTIKYEAKSQDKYEHLRKYIYDLLKGYEEVDFTDGVNVDSLIK